MSCSAYSISLKAGHYRSPWHKGEFSPSPLTPSVFHAKKITVMPTWLWSIGYHNVMLVTPSVIPKGCYNSTLSISLIVTDCLMHWCMQPRPQPVWLLMCPATVSVLISCQGQLSSVYSSLRMLFWLSHYQTFAACGLKSCSVVGKHLLLTFLPLSFLYT